MHLLIVKLSAIGDVVLTLPAVAALRDRYPDARISWVVDAGAGAILDDSPLIDQLIKLKTSAWGKRPFSAETRQVVSKVFKQLRTPPVDIALDFQGLLKSALVARLSGAPRRIGFSTKELREPASRIFLTEQIGPAEGGHMIEKNLRLAEAAGASLKGAYQFPIAISEATELSVSDHLAQLEIDDFVILNPGGGWVTKLWAPESYGTLADWLWETHGLRSIVTYGPGEIELAARVAEASNFRVALPLATTLKQFMALAKRSRLLVSGDTGPMHMAAAVGTPIVAMFGPTAEHRNGPFSEIDVVLGRDVPCRVNCYRRTCNKWICMDIPPEEVQKAVEKRLVKLSPSSRQSANGLHSESSLVPLKADG